MDHGVDVEQW